MAQIKTGNYKRFLHSSKAKATKNVGKIQTGAIEPCIDCFLRVRYLESVGEASLQLPHAGPQRSKADPDVADPRYTGHFHDLSQIWRHQRHREG